MAYVDNWGHNKRSCKSNHASYTKNMGVGRSSSLQLHVERGRLLVGPHNLKIIAGLTPILALFILNIERTDCWAGMLELYIGLVV